ncbi:hypothetical protein [Evansella clarkii]|uniref:hypothetical protein n=1 Tax=Evansella clarkii TaxID=79879 RepID=UPI000B4344A8|nr:hypothetical protein [Evansella clarkii]
MPYKVINRFKDTKDNDGHIYEAGDPYPAEGKKATKKRIEELSKVHPKYKKVFIEEVKDEPSSK